MHQQDEAPAGPEPVAQAPAPAVQETAPTPQAPRETATPEDGGKFEIHEIGWCPEKAKAPLLET